MRVSRCFGLLALACSSSSTNLHSRSHDTHDYYAVHLHQDAAPAQVAAVLGLDLVGKLGELPDHYTFSSPKARQHGADNILEELRLQRRKRVAVTGQSALDGILWHQKQKPKPRMEKRNTIPSSPERQAIESAATPAVAPEVPQATALLPAQQAAISMRDQIARELEIRDPIFGDQWHLYNTVQLGHDINVTGVWTQGITGHNATVVMVDDGIDMYSDDLKDNYFAEGSYDFNDNTDEPRPRLSDDHHGTRCAGEIAAVRNGVCGVGAAYDAKIGGLRILSKVITDEDEAVAMNYMYQKNQIYSCSWGPPDDGRSMDAPGILIKKAMLNAVQRGRQGKGTIYVFAAGNGASSGDNCNFDGYTNSIYSITVGAIDRKGLHPYYSEKCSAQLVVTYSSGSGDAIHTTDVGTNECYANHGGTSAAAPLGAGVFALALSVRPELTWRDLQHILVQTAVPVNEEESWDTTSIGRKYSHTYGYGKLDAYAIVEKAKTIELVKPQAWFKSPWLHVKHRIPQGVEGLLSTFEVTKEALEKANFERIEHVTVTMNVNHTRRGDLSVELRSPTRMVSHLSVTRRLDDAKSGYDDWTFMSVAHWGETGIGKWSIIVKDTNVNEHNGTFTDWRLTLWGESIDGSKQELLPMPTEHDDDDHDVISASASTTTISHVAGETPSANPSDHIDRPVNAKPTAPAPVTGQSSSASAGVTSKPGVTPTTSAAPSSSTTSTPDTFLPHYFPTFGVSKKTQIWIYGSFAIIVLFCAGLGTYFLVQRRKRARINRDDYEFEMVNDDDANTGLSGRTKGKRSKRGGELYDAFAGESDEELLSDEEEEHEEYRDKGPRNDSEDKSRPSLEERYSEKQ